jgi:hypothetical protein
LFSSAHAGPSRLLRDPLFHFLVLGAALFGVYRLVSARSPGEQRIVVTAGTVRSLAEGFRATWQRPPTEGELQGLVADHLREEVLVREARRLGLDQDDAIVRRRLRTRMEIMLDDTAEIAPPTDLQLQEYLDRHPEDFQQDGRTTFVQLYLSPERRGARLEADLTRVKALLDRAGPGVDVVALGDPTLLDARFDAAPDRDLIRTFGPEFVRALATAPVDHWSGPVRSGYGAHFVRVLERVPGHPARLDEVREGVQREWLTRETARRREAAIEALLRRYQISVEPSAVETAVPRAAR